MIHFKNVFEVSSYLYTDDTDTHLSFLLLYCKASVEAQTGGKGEFASLLNPSL